MRCVVDFDVVVVGGGNAGFSAAHSAAERGARVLLLEKAPEAEAGGNCFYAAGAFRFTFDDIDDVTDLLEPDERHADSVVPAYLPSAFHPDMDRVTGGRCDPVLTCHSTAWDADADPDGGNRELTNQLTRQSCPIGIVVNRAGERFVDEGVDFRNYTYAKYGREILRQPGGRAFQLFDAKTRPLQRAEEYDSHPIAAAQADTLPELAEALGIDADRLARTAQEFNESIVDAEFDPAVKDGRAAHVEQPSPTGPSPSTPRPTADSRSGAASPSPSAVCTSTPTPACSTPPARRSGGLFACGEMVGGLFSGLAGARPATV